MSDYDILPGELLTFEPRPTGVIIGVHSDITVETAETIRADLERRFPGVRFAIVSGCSSLITFGYDPEPTP